MSMLLFLQSADTKNLSVKPLKTSDSRSGCPLALR